MSAARARVADALLMTQKALTIIPDAPGRNLSDKLGYVHPTYLEHLLVHFRLKRIGDLPAFMAVLRAINERLQILLAGMRSPKLRFAQYGYNWLPPENAKAYVRMPVSWVAARLKDGCLNIDPKSFKNANDVNLRFEAVPGYSMEDFTDTLIHECTHKYLGTADRCISGLPFKNWAEYEANWRALEMEPPLGPLANLDTDQAVTDAYAFTNYCLHLPDSDLDAYVAHMERQDRANIGGPGNQAVFNSISNDDL